MTFCTTDPTPSPIDCVNHKNFAPDLSDAHKFYYCTNGKPVPPPVDCPTDMITGEKLVFNPIEELCEVTEIVKCPQPDGVFAYEKDKHKYIVCKGGHASVMTCPEGTIFDGSCKEE